MQEVERVTTRHAEHGSCPKGQVMTSRALGIGSGEVA